MVGDHEMYLICWSATATCWPAAIPHNERNRISNHWHLKCLLRRLFKCRSKKTSKLHVTGLCEGNPPVTGGFPNIGPVTRNASISFHMGLQHNGPHLEVKSLQLFWRWYIWRFNLQVPIFKWDAVTWQGWEGARMIVLAMAVRWQAILLWNLRGSLTHPPPLVPHIRVSESGLHWFR